MDYKNMDVDTQSRIDGYAVRYSAAMHAVQSGVAMEHARGSNDGSPKHLRVGINSCMITEQGLAQLLMDKGLFTLEEYHKYVAEAAEQEKLRYEAALSEQLGRKVTLG